MLEAFVYIISSGGMPAAVQKYLALTISAEVYEEQRGIIRTYKRDITQYDHDHKLQIEEIYDLIPSELNAKNKRFILKELNEKARFSKYEDSFLWLRDAGVAIPAYNVEEPRVPLLLNKREIFSNSFSNIRFAAAMYGGNIQARMCSVPNPNTTLTLFLKNLVPKTVCSALLKHSNIHFTFQQQETRRLTLW
jgi:hypothetical protein